jgi:uncharacterized protein
MITWLVDTGPLVAYLDANDPAHADVAPLWDGFTGRLATTSAVITEAMHFVAASPDGARSLAELAAAASLEVFDLTQAPELREAAALMTRYADTPMDFADATLLLLAEAIDVHDILTLDRRGFAVYRTRDNRWLRNVLDTAG